MKIPVIALDVVVLDGIAPVVVDAPVVVPDVVVPVKWWKETLKIHVLSDVGLVVVDPDVVVVVVPVKDANKLSFMLISKQITMKHSP